MKQRQCFIVFLCLGIVLISSAHREELEKAAELAVETAAERAAERAVEKTFDNGNIITGSKIIRELYSHIRKYPGKEKKYDYDRYNPMNNEEDSEEDVDDWSTYSRFVPQNMRGREIFVHSKINFRNTSNIRRRFPGNI